MSHRARGFTLIELLIVVSLIGTLLALVSPRYWNGVDKAREAVLRENLYITRDAIDKYFADRGHYPESLETLVHQRYLRSVPIDPVTERTDSWKVVPPADERLGKLAGIRSGAPGKAKDGSRYGDW